MASRGTVPIFHRFRAVGGDVRSKGSVRTSAQCPAVHKKTFAGARDGRPAVPATKTACQTPLGAPSGRRATLLRSVPIFHRNRTGRATLGAPSAAQGDLRAVTGAHALPTLTENIPECCGELGDANGLCCGALRPPERLPPRGSLRCTHFLPRQTSQDKPNHGKSTYIQLQRYYF